MRLQTVFSGLLLSSLTMGPAAYADEPSCDFFVNALIGTKCKDTISAGGSTSVQKTTVERSTPFVNLRQDVTSNTATGQFSITPLSWLTLGFNSSYGWSTNQVQAANNNGNTFASTTQNDGIGGQNFVANVTLLDTGAGAQRYLINAYAGDTLTPANGNVPDANTVYGGVTGSARWRLGQSPFSLNGQVGAQLAHYSRFEETAWFPSAKLLLSHDALGIAIGPTYSASLLLSGGYPTWTGQSSRAGGEVVIQPFRNSDSAFLNGLIVTGAANHSLGQANWISPLNGDATSMTYSIAAAFHFRY